MIRRVKNKLVEKLIFNLELKNRELKKNNVISFVHVIYGSTYNVQQGLT